MHGTTTAFLIFQVPYRVAVPCVPAVIKRTHQGIAECRMQGAECRMESEQGSARAASVLPKMNMPLQSLGHSSMCIRLILPCVFEGPQQAGRREETAKLTS